MTLHTRHAGILSLGGIATANVFASAFCGSYDPTNPVSLGTSLVIGIFTLVDWLKNNNSDNKPVQ